MICFAAVLAFSVNDRHIVLIRGRWLTHDPLLLSLKGQMSGPHYKGWLYFFNIHNSSPGLIKIVYVLVSNNID